ncbi:MAG: hypothetical protein ACJAS2_001438 [Pseudohongiellaceae bacterium]|jgi:hypothetical protein
MPKRLGAYEIEHKHFSDLHAMPSMSGDRWKSLDLRAEVLGAGLGRQTSLTFVFAGELGIQILIVNTAKGINLKKLAPPPSPFLS